MWPPLIQSSTSSSVVATAQRLFTRNGTDTSAGQTDVNDGSVPARIFQQRFGKGAYFAVGVFRQVEIRGKKNPIGTATSKAMIRYTGAPTQPAGSNKFHCRQRKFGRPIVVPRRNACQRMQGGEKFKCLEQHRHTMPTVVQESPRRRSKDDPTPTRNRSTYCAPKIQARACASAG